MASNLDIPPAFYGELLTSTARVVAWNAWGLYGPWEKREAAIAATLQQAGPDIVVLAESWARDNDSQCARLAGPLGLPHHAFSGVPAQEDGSALSGVGVMSRWPISSPASLAFGSLRVQFARIDGPRGPLQVYGVVMDAWWLDESQARQDAVRGLFQHLHGSRDDRTPMIVCLRLQRGPGK